MDIIWLPEFGANGWTVPLEDKWPASDRANYLPGPLAGCTYNGKLWAAPYFTDIGVIYYRTDLIKTHPSYWDELVSMAKQASPSKTKFGYLWQGALYEATVGTPFERLLIPTRRRCSSLKISMRGSSLSRSSVSYTIVGAMSRKVCQFCSL